MTILEAQSLIVHVILSDETHLRKVEDELWKYGEIIAQNYLRARDNHQRLQIKSANYLVLVQKENLVKFYETCRDLNNSGTVFLTVESPWLGVEP